MMVEEVHRFIVCRFLFLPIIYRYGQPDEGGQFYLP